MTSPHLSRDDLGDEIRKRRKARNLRQTDLARTAAVATTLVGKAERGEVVSATTLRAIARALEMPTEMVSAFVDEPKEDEPVAEPRPEDYANEYDYMKAVYWYLRRGFGMSHEAVQRGFDMAAAIFERKNKAERDDPNSSGNKVG